MIRSVTVTNYTGDSLKIELAKPFDTGMLIYNITGIGASNASINIAEMSTTDGALFSSARVESRNIVLYIRFVGNDVETVRQKTYKYFPIKRKVTLEFETDNRISVIDGYVEKNDPQVFQKQEYTQISIICPYPYFYQGGEGGTNITYFYGVNPLFEFPFSNESLEAPVIEMGQIVQEPTKSIWYEGDSSVGVKIYIHALGTAKNISVANLDTQQVMHIDTDKIASIMDGDGFKAGDDIEISTVQGEKYVRLLRDGEYTNILNALGKDADWFQIAKGDNRFAFTAEEGISNLQFRIENRMIFEGV